jgi:hypothetical protein
MTTCVNCGRRIHWYLGEWVHSDDTLPRCYPVDASPPWKGQRATASMDAELAQDDIVREGEMLNPRSVATEWEEFMQR